MSIRCLKIKNTYSKKIINIVDAIPSPDCTFEAMRFLYMLGHRMTAEAGL